MNLDKRTNVAILQEIIARSKSCAYESQFIFGEDERQDLREIVKELKQIEELYSNCDINHLGQKLLDRDNMDFLQYQNTHCPHIPPIATIITNFDNVMPQPKQKLKRRDIDAKKTKPIAVITEKFSKAQHDTTASKYLSDEMEISDNRTLLKKTPSPRKNCQLILDSTNQGVQFLKNVGDRCKSDIPPDELLESIATTPDKVSKTPVAALKGFICPHFSDSSRINDITVSSIAIDTDPTSTLIVEPTEGSTILQDSSLTQIASHESPCNGCSLTVIKQTCETQPTETNTRDLLLTTSIPYACTNNSEINIVCAVKSRELESDSYSVSKIIEKQESCVSENNQAMVQSSQLLQPPASPLYGVHLQASNYSSNTQSLQSDSIVNFENELKSASIVTVKDINQDDNDLEENLIVESHKNNKNETPTHLLEIPQHEYTDSVSEKELSYSSAKKVILVNRDTCANDDSFKNIGIEYSAFEITNEDGMFDPNDTSVIIDRTTMICGSLKQCQLNEMSGLFSKPQNSAETLSIDEFQPVSARYQCDIEHSKSKFARSKSCPVLGPFKQNTERNSIYNYLNRSMSESRHWNPLISKDKTQEWNRNRLTPAVKRKAIESWDIYHQQTEEKFQANMRDVHERMQKLRERKAKDKGELLSKIVLDREAFREAGPLHFSTKTKAHKQPVKVIGNTMDSTPPPPKQKQKATVPPLESVVEGVPNFRGILKKTGRLDQVLNQIQKPKESPRSSLVKDQMVKPSDVRALFEKRAQANKEDEAVAKEWWLKQVHKYKH